MSERQSCSISILSPRLLSPVYPFLAILLLLTAPLCFGQIAQQPPANRTVKWYTCSMHPQVRLPKAGKCPACLMELIPVYGLEEEHVSIPEGRLQKFCEAYITEAMANIEKQEAYNAWAIVGSYVDIYGKDSIERLREILKSSSLELVAAGAHHLGKMGDSESVSRLKDLLTSDRLQLPKMTFKCDNHPEVTYYKPSRCPKCQTELFGSLPGAVMNARPLVAGALHAMNEPAGLEALKEMLRNPYYRVFAFGPLALRDTKEVRQLLDAGAKDETDEWAQAIAIEGLFHLGDNRYVPEAIRLLESKYAHVRETALGGLAKAHDQKVEAALIKFFSRKDIESYEQLTAAHGLVGLGKKEYIKFIVDACAKASRDSDASSEFWTLGEVGGMEHLTLLKNAIEKNARNRLWAVAATIKILRREDQ